jgi:hypothetical protein
MTTTNQPIPKRQVNFVNNKDILAEIHKSKTSYCTFLDQSVDHEYDFIVEIPDNTLQQNLEYALRPETIQKAKENRAARKSSTGNKIDPNSILESDLVFRVMTWDHVPLSKKQPRKVVKKKTAKDILDFEDPEDSLFEDLEDTTTKQDVDDLVHMKVNFPPFQHFRLDKNNTLSCIGKSHWKGDLETGEFSKDHGQTTTKLAKMYIMMCEKYALKFNWRGYTYVDEMRNSAILQLAYVGLRFNEARSSQAFSYITQTIHNAFLRVLNTEKRSQNLRDDILEINGLNPSYSRQSSSNTRYEE